MTKARDIADGTGGIDTTGFLTSDSTLNPSKLDSSGTIPSQLLAGVGGGITGADMWTLQNDETGNMIPITASKVARCAEGSFEKIGTGMTINGNNEFVFPETGIWLVKFNVVTYASAASDYVNCKIEACIDTGTFQPVAQCMLGATTGVAFNTGSCEAVIDVHDTSYVKVKFSVDHANTGNLVRGSNDRNRTSMTFIRLADT